MIWIVYITALWLSYVYVWTSYANKEILRLTEWNEMNYRQKARRIFLFPGWALHVGALSNKRSWVQLWAYMDHCEGYSGSSDSFPCFLLRQMVKKDGNSYKEQSELVRYKLISIFPFLGLNVLLTSLLGGIWVLILTIIHIPTFIRYVFRTLTNKLINWEMKSLSFLKAEDYTPFGKIESQIRHTNSVLGRLDAYLGSLKVQENEVVNLLAQYSYKAFSQKTTALGQSNFIRTKELLEQKWQEKINLIGVATKKVQDVKEAISQLSELKTMVAVLQKSEDAAAQAEVQELLAQANEVCGNVSALEVEVLFGVLSEQGNYEIPYASVVAKELQS